MIETIYGRLLELAWQTRDYAVISALFAHAKGERTTFTSSTACKRVIWSEFGLFERCHTKIAE